MVKARDFDSRIRSFKYSRPRQRNYVFLIKQIVKRGRCHPPRRVCDGSEVAKSSALKALAKHTVARLTIFFFGGNMEDNWIGKQLGPYEVLERTDEKDSSGHTKYRIKCRHCLREFLSSPRLLSRLQDHCTHENKYGVRSFSTKSHSPEDQRLHRIFLNMQRRCYDPTNRDYRFYGAKGVTICKEWLEAPETFITWAKGNGYQSNLTIDRIDSSQGYSPKNCRWIEAKQNAAYKSTTIPITVDGITRTGKEWARVLHLGVNTINRYRRKNGLEATENYIKSKLDAI